jgi:hypothetical protein
MGGMDAGPGTELGGLGWFAVGWVTMMAAMMLPSIAPMVLAHARFRSGPPRPSSPGTSSRGRPSARSATRSSRGCGRWTSASSPGTRRDRTSRAARSSPRPDGSGLGARRGGAGLSCRRASCRSLTGSPASPLLSSKASVSARVPETLARDEKQKGVSSAQDFSFARDSAATLSIFQHRQLRRHSQTLADPVVSRLWGMRSPPARGPGQSAHGDGFGVRCIRTLHCWRHRPFSTPQTLPPTEQRLQGCKQKVAFCSDYYGRYWARTSDPQLVELVLSQLS